MSLWTKARELELSPWPKIVTVGLVSGNHVLTGQRRDNKLWTSPGGHVDENEDIMSAGRREVLEESGIDLAGVDLHLIRAERLVSHRTGKPFVVFGFIANVDKQLATGKADPDQEVSTWRWVKVDKATPELQASARHAKDDFILSHLGLNKGVAMGADKKKPPEPEDKGRTMKEVSKDTQNAGFNESPEPEEPKQPEPEKLTPEEMQQNPEVLLNPPDKGDPKSERE